jgi:hypothetical protein
MSTAKARIYKTGSPAGWAWTFDITTNPDASIDNVGTATAAAQAIDAIKALVPGMAGTLSTIDMTIQSFEP